MPEGQAPECPVCHRAMEVLYEMTGRGGLERIYKCEGCKLTRLVRPGA